MNELYLLVVCANVKQKERENEELELVATTDQVLGTWTQIIPWRAIERAREREREREDNDNHVTYAQSIPRKIIHSVAAPLCVLCSVRIEFLSGFCFMSIFDYMFILLLSWTTVIIDNDVAQCVMLPSTTHSKSSFARSLMLRSISFHSIPFRSVCTQNVYIFCNVCLLFDFFSLKFVLNEWKIKKSLYSFVFSWISPNTAQTLMAILACIANRCILYIHIHHPILATAKEFFIICVYT